MCFVCVVAYAVPAKPVQFDGNGLFDRYFHVWRMVSSNRSILLPVMHQCLDFAADNRRSGFISQWHEIPPRNRINGTYLPPVAVPLPD